MLTLNRFAPQNFNFAPQQFNFPTHNSRPTFQGGFQPMDQGIYQLLSVLRELMSAATQLNRGFAGFAAEPAPTAPPVSTPPSESVKKSGNVAAKPTGTSPQAATPSAAPKGESYQELLARGRKTPASLSGDDINRLLSETEPSKLLGNAAPLKLLGIEMPDGSVPSAFAPQSVFEGP